MGARAYVTHRDEGTGPRRPEGTAMTDRPIAVARAAALSLLLGLAGVAARADEPATRGWPGPREMADSLLDVWGEAALMLPGGPSYEAFRDLLPPIRYTNTRFRHYPVVLGAPAAPVKARWISNGGGINARADKPPMWKEPGRPVSFHVGKPSRPFGVDPSKVDGPRYRDGHLPVLRIRDAKGPTAYEQVAFAPVRGPLADAGAVLVRFATSGEAAALAARVDDEAAVSAGDGSVRDAEGKALLLYGPGWTWDASARSLRAEPGRPVELAVLTRPMAPPFPTLDAASYDDEEQACLDRWKAILATGTGLAIPEPVVQDAWRSLLVGNFLVAVGDRMHYSAGNAYDHLYEAECGDATRAMMLFGFGDESRRMVLPMLEFNRQATRYHVAGHKLQLLAHYYWVTRDAESLRAWEPIWGPVISFVTSSRGKENGLLPPDRYAGDIDQNVYSLNSNANCWRGLRDMAAVLADLGRREEAEALAREAGAYREAILDAVAKSERLDTKPPFIPVALFGAEAPYETLTSTRMGSYYDLMAPYILGSGVFGPKSPREGWMIDYLRSHGGLAMGMIRSTPHQGQFDNMPGVNPLYGLRYQLALLRRDDAGHALVGFYGHLAQGLTRDTFIGGEGEQFLNGDERGRSFYLPPNAASNAAVLTTLRYLLIQDWDLDDDGRPETLRLLHGAPGRWLRDGATLAVTRAPTAFGEISFRAKSLLEEGAVTLAIDAPPRKPDSWLVRLPLPPGWVATGAEIDGAGLPLGPGGAVDLTGRAGQFTLRVRVGRIPGAG
jgi:hypothetical protein